MNTSRASKRPIIAGSGSADHTYSSRRIGMRVKTAPAWLRRVCGVGPYGSHLDGRLDECAPSTVDNQRDLSDPQLQRVCSFPYPISEAA